MQLTGKRHTEDDCCDALEAMDPLLALRSLTANIEHSENEKKFSIRFLHSISCNSLEVKSLEAEVRLNNPRGFDSRPQHVLLGGHVRRLCDPIEGI
jgi:hypothetical protein